MFGSEDGGCCAREIEVPEVARASLDSLSAFGAVTRVKPQRGLFRRGDLGTDVFRLVRGHVKVSVTSRDGRDLTFCVMGPGEFLGEIAAFGDGRRSASVVALDEAELLCVSKRDLLGVLEQDAALAACFFGLVAKRLRQTSEVRERLRFCGMRAQLAEVLLRLADRFGSPVQMGGDRCGKLSSEAVRIDVRLSQRELGSLVGTSRVSANRQLCRWRESGIISEDRGYIVVAQPRSLEQIASRSRISGPSSIH